MPSCGNLHIMSVMIWSGPGALRGWRCLTTPCSSPVVNGHSVSEDGGGDVSFRVISRSGVALWGLYTSVSCLANTLVFSVSLLAQGLGGVVFAQIGGYRVCGFFLDLIGLYMVWSSLRSDAMYAEKASLFSSQSAPLSLLFALLNLRLSSGVCVLCHLALALRF